MGLSDKLAAPTGLHKVSSLSSKTVLTMQWSAVTGGVSPAGDIIGYKLQVEDANTGSTWIAFDG